MVKLVTRGITVSGLLLALILATAPPAAAAPRVIHKSTRDLWGVHIAVVLEWTGAPVTPLRGFCSLSGNSQVLKRIVSCAIYRGTPQNPQLADRINGPTLPSGSNRVLWLDIGPWCDRNYSAWITYELQPPGGGYYVTAGRTIYADVC